MTITIQPPRIFKGAEQIGLLSENGVIQLLKKPSGFVLGGIRSALESPKAEYVIVKEFPVASACDGEKQAEGFIGFSPPPATHSSDPEPPMDPAAGDKTPAWVAWHRRNMSPEEHHRRYGHRKVSEE